MVTIRGQWINTKNAKIESFGTPSCTATKYARFIRRRSIHRQRIAINAVVFAPFDARGLVRDTLASLRSIVLASVSSHRQKGGNFAQVVSLVHGKRNAGQMQSGGKDGRNVYPTASSSLQTHHRQPNVDCSVCQF